MSGDPPLRVLDLYAGAGGFSAGFGACGYEIVLAVERDADAAETFRANHPGTCVLEVDVRELDAATLLSAADGPIDVVLAGPPCQGFSLSRGARDSSHESGELLLEVARVVHDLEPAAFVIENVPGVFSFRGGFVLDALVRRLNRAGAAGRYETVLETLDAAGYGVPQHRRRVFIAGALGEAFCFPAPQSDRISLEDAIGDLPEWTADSQEALALPRAHPLTAYQRDRRRRTRALYNHSSKQLEEMRMRRIAELRQGEDRRDLPDELQSGGRPGKYRRLRAGKPAPTILAHMGKDTSDFIHPYYPRMLTVREAARLQSFDDTHLFYGSQASQFRQVGNAVPPLLAGALAVALQAPAQRARQRLEAFAADALSERRAVSA